MGNCTYCGKPAGFLRGKHAECEQQYLQRQRVIEEGRECIAAEVSRVIKGTESFAELEKTISEVEKTSMVPSIERNAILVKAWEASVDQFLEDGVLDEAEEKRLVEFKNHFALSHSDLDKNGALLKTTKAAVLRDVLNGVIPPRMTVDGNIPINFQKSERLVWAFPTSEYLEDKTTRQYVGGSKGVSVRVMKGIYYREALSRGMPLNEPSAVILTLGGLSLRINTSISLARLRVSAFHTQKSFRFSRSAMVLVYCEMPQLQNLSYS